MNPKESPETPKFKASLLEVVWVITITCTLVAVLVPAVKAARETDGEPVSYPLIEQFSKQHPWLFVFSVAILSCLLSTLVLSLFYRLLPRKYRKHFHWNFSTKPEPPQPIEDSLPAKRNLMVAAVGAGLLIIAGLHIRVDRPTRRAVVTYEGPLADIVEPIAFIGWALSVFAFVFGLEISKRYKTSPRFLNYAGSYLAAFTLFCSVVALAAAYED